MRILLTVLVAIAVIFFHLWLYLFTDLPWWGYGLILGGEVLLLVLIRNGGRVVRRLFDLSMQSLRMLSALAAACARAVLRGIGDGGRWLSAVWCLCRCWWRLPRGGGARRMRWVWLLSASADPLAQAAEDGLCCLRAICNDRFRLQLWQSGGLLLLEQRVWPASPHTGRDYSGAGLLQWLMDRLAMYRLGSGRCAGVIWNPGVPSSSNSPWSLDEAQLQQALSVCAQRHATIFGDGGPPLAVLIDGEHPDRDPSQLFPVPGAPAPGEILFWQPGYDDATTTRMLADLEHLRHQALRGAMDSTSRILALRLPGKLLRLNDILEHSAGRPWGAGLRFQARALAGVNAGTGSTLSVLLHSLTEAAGATLLPVARRPWHRPLRRVLWLPLLLSSLCLFFVDRAMVLPSLGAQEDTAVLTEPDQAWQLRRRLQSLQSRWQSPLLPLPGDGALQALEQGWRHRYAALIEGMMLKEASRTQAAAATDAADAYRLLLYRQVMQLLGGGPAPVGRDRQHDLGIVLAELCTVQRQSGLCEARELLDSYRAWRPESVPGQSDAAASVTTERSYRDADWMAMFSALAPAGSTTPVPYLCTAAGLNRAEALWSVLDAWGKSPTDSALLRRGIVHQCRQSWLQAAQGLGQECHGDADGPLLGPQSPQGRLLIAAAASHRVLMRIVAAPVDDTALQQAAALEQLPADIGALVPAVAGDDASLRWQTRGLQLWQRLLQRWQGRTGAAGEAVVLARPAATEPAALFSVSDVYAVYLAGLYQVRQRAENGDGAVEIARMTLAGEAGGPLNQVHTHVTQLRRRGDGDAWSEALAVMMDCRAARLWQRTLAMAAQRLKSRWRELASAPVISDEPLARLNAFYGAEGYLASFARDELREFIDFAPSQGITVRQRYDQGLPLRRDFVAALRALRGLGGSLDSGHRIGVDIRPVGVNAGALRMPHRLELLLDCSEPQSLAAANYRQGGELLWMPRGCGDLRLRVAVGDAVLERRYPGALGILAFAADFRHGERELPLSTFTIEGKRADLAGITSLRIAIDLTLPESVKAIAAALKAGFPESPV